MTKKVRALENLDTLGVSLVKRGANRKRFIKKAEGIMDSDTIEILKTILEDVPAENEANAEEIFKTGIDEKAQGAITGLARLMSSFKDVLSPDYIAKAAELAGMEDITKALHRDLPGERQPEAADGTIVRNPGKVTAKSGHKNKDKDKDEDKNKDKPVFKSDDDIPEHMKEQLEKLWKSNEEAIKKAEAAEARSSKLESEALVKSFIAKAEKDLNSVPGKADEIGMLLKSLHDQNPETAAKVESLLKSANSALNESDIFKVYGSSRAGSSTVNTEIEGLAKEMVTKSEKGISYAEAYVKAMDSRPELYNQYLQEHPKQIS